MQVRNSMEDIVQSLLPEIIRGYNNICSCEQCINDIKAITLNNLPVRYVSTEKGAILSKANTFTIQSEIDVTSVLIEAIEKVKEHPKHKVMK